MSSWWIIASCSCQGLFVFADQRGWKPEISNSSAGLLKLVNQSGHMEPQKVHAADAEGPKHSEEHTICWECGAEIFFSVKCPVAKGSQVLSGRASEQGMYLTDFPLSPNLMQRIPSLDIHFFGINLPTVTQQSLPTFWLFFTWSVSKHPSQF